MKPCFQLFPGGKKKTAITKAREGKGGSSCIDTLVPQTAPHILSGHSEGPRLCHDTITLLVFPFL